MDKKNNKEKDLQKQFEEALELALHQNREEFLMKQKKNSDKEDKNASSDESQKSDSIKK